MAMAGPSAPPACSQCTARTFSEACKALVDIFSGNVACRSVEHSNALCRTWLRHNR